MNQTPTAVALTHLTKSFPGGVRAVDDLTLEVAERELLVLMGPSGCGKTTTLRMVAGLERPTEGSIRIAGRVVDCVPPKDRDVAMVFQQGALYPHLSAFDNMAFGLRRRGIDRGEIERRIGEAASWLCITNLLARRPRELSGGQQQRVALGRAIVRQPKLFLFDEPLSNLDASLRHQLRQEIRQVHARSGVAAIYVTHDQDEAMALGHRIAVLRDGRLQQHTDPQTLYHRPVNRFVAGLLGSPAMNFFAGRIDSTGGLLAFATSDQDAIRLPVPNRWKAAVKSYGPKPITLGIRPEHLELLAAADDTLCIRATVEAVERLGAESQICLRASGHTFLMRVGVEVSPRADERVALTAAPEHLYFFDAATDQALDAT